MLQTTGKQHLDLKVISDLAAIGQCLSSKLIFAGHRQQGWLSHVFEVTADEARLAPYIQTIATFEASGSEIGAWMAPICKRGGSHLLELWGRRPLAMLIELFTR